MRCIETMGAKRKPNGHIAEYDFYDPNNMLIVDRQNPVVPSGFMTTSLPGCTCRNIRPYRIDRWLEMIFEP